MTDHLEFLDSVLREAAGRLSAVTGSQAAEVKPGEPSQVVTAADRETEALLTDRIRAAYPGHGVLGEETGRSGGPARETWVIDPIDGTSNFASGSPLFGIMLGLLVDGEPVAGGVALPRFGQVYLARRGAGAFLDGQRFHTPDAAGLESALIAYGIDADSPETARTDFARAAAIALRCRGLRMSNSVFDLMQVATGAYGGCLNRTTRIWDNVAPQVIIEEAGGRYTTFSGTPMTYDPLDLMADARFTLCAAAPGLHGQIQDILRTEPPE